MITLSLIYDLHCVKLFWNQGYTLFYMKFQYCVYCPHTVAMYKQKSSHFFLQCFHGLLNHGAACVYKIWCMYLMCHYSTSAHPNSKVYLHKLWCSSMSVCCKNNKDLSCSPQNPYPDYTSVVQELARRHILAVRPFNWFINTNTENKYFYYLLIHSLALMDKHSFLTSLY